MKFFILLIACLCWLCTPTISYAETKLKTTTTLNKENQSVQKKVKQTQKQNSVKKKPTQNKLAKKGTLNKKKKLPKKLIPKKTTPVNQPILQQSMSKAIRQKLVNFVHYTISNLSYSAYRFGGTHFDPHKGVYVLDCSSYVDRLLQTVYPRAYSNLVQKSGSTKPTTEHYYDFFTQLKDHHSGYWDKIDEVDELKAGDILVFRYKNTIGRETGGHIMIVMDKPVRVGNDFFVKVADSAGGAHSEDTRFSRISGIGIGTLVLKVDPKTEEPNAFSWRIGSSFKKNVNFAMARPIDVLVN